MSSIDWTLLVEEQIAELQNPSLEGLDKYFGYSFLGCGVKTFLSWQTSILCTGRELAQEWPLAVGIGDMQHITGER